MLPGKDDTGLEALSMKCLSKVVFYYLNISAGRFNESSF